MTRWFLSGGTTSRPRLVSHEHCEWVMRVADTAYVLKHFGLTAGAEVLIGQPSFPWDIGEVFAQAVDLCRADAVCLGLDVVKDSLRTAATLRKPRFLIVPPRILLSWPDSMRKVTRGATLVCVGEPLQSGVGDQLMSTLLLERIVSIYGHSEMGTLGYQAGTEANLYAMNPRFSYEIVGEGSLDGPGELAVKSRYNNTRILTGDNATLEEFSSTDGLWSGGHCVRLLGRRHETIFLVDGTMIDARALKSIQHEFALDAIQLVREIKDNREVITFHAAPGSRQAFDIRGFRRRIEDSFIELMDCAQRGLCQIRIVETEVTKLHSTVRGKLPAFVDLVEEWELS